MTGAELARPDPEPVAGADTLAYLGLDPRRPEVHALVLLCRRYGLDPLLGHASVIVAKKGGNRAYITRDGMLEIAHRSGQLDGIVVDEQRRNTENDGWTAYVSVWRKDMSHPFRYGAQCKDSESQAEQGNGPEMALARAERRALRRAFNIPVSDDDSDDADLADLPAIEPPPEQFPGRRPAATRPPPKASPSRRPPARDAPPADYYDNLPEARGYDPRNPAGQLRKPGPVNSA
jgi:RecT family protein